MVFGPLEGWRHGEVTNRHAAYAHRDEFLALTRVVA